MALKIHFFQFLKTGEKISNERIHTLHIGNISIICRAILIKYPSLYITKKKHTLEQGYLT